MEHGYQDWLVYRRLGGWPGSGCCVLGMGRADHRRAAPHGGPLRLPAHTQAPLVRNARCF